MDGPQRQEKPSWAAQVVLSVTGVPKAERAAIQELVERAGGRYSPNLSRRCTHLAVPDGVSERSEKLHSALRNRHKWGLHLVDLRWVLESAQAGQRLEEAGFPVHPLPQEQAAPSVSGRRPACSWAGSAGQASEQAADTYRQPQGHLGLPSATVAAAAARAARPTDPLRQSVNSRPLSSFAGGQPAPSLQTQVPSAGRSVRWQVSEGSPTQWGASSGGAAAAAHAAAAAVLPGQVEQQCLGQQEADEELDFSKLPMTQAGFIPAADLLEQLRASTAGLLHAEPAPQPPQPAQPQQQCQSLQPQLGMQPAQQHGSPAGWQPQPPAQPQVQRYAWRGSPEQPGPCSMQVDARLPLASPGAHSLAMARQGAAAAAPTSTAGLLQQLRLSSGVQQQQPPSQQQPPPQEAKQPAIPTDVLVQQLRASAIMASVQGEQQQQQQQQQRKAHQQPGGRLATEDLLAALRAAPAAGAAGQRQPEPEAQQAEFAGAAAGAAATPGLLLQLQQATGLSVPAAQHMVQQTGQQQAAPATADLLQQLQAAHMPAASKQQQAVRAAPATADLLQQLHAAAVPAAASVKQQSKQQPARSTAELLEQLRASADFRSVGSRLPAQQAQHGVESGTAGQQSSTAAAEVQAGGFSGLLQQLQQLPSAAVRQPQQPVQPAAAADVPVVQAEVAAAAASCLADQMRSLLQEAQPAAGLGTPLAAAPAAGGQPGSGSSRSTEELLALLRHQQEQRHGADEPPAASVATDGGAGELLAKLRELAPPAAAVPLHSQALAAAGWQQQQPQQAQRAASGPASEDEEMPPAKYQRQDEPESHAAAAFGTLPAARQASAAPPATPAADAGSAEGDGGSLAPTAMVSGAQADGASSPSGSVPASSAGSPPLVRPQAGTPPAPAPADAVSPAGSGSGKPDAASSQVAESCRVFGSIMAIVDPSLPAEEQQRVAAALEQGGGRMAAGGSLTRGVTHVVCQPDQALKWLSMGVGIVSPAWVLQSLRTGKQQRCLMVSADASRHLPAASTAAGGSSQQPGSSEARSGGGNSGMHASGQQLNGDLLASKEARQQALLQLNGKGAAAAACAGASTPGTAGPSLLGGHRPAATPAELLVGVLWSVLEAPHTARLEARCQPRSGQEGDEEPVVIIPDSEDEEEQARLCCISASQAAVADVLCEAAGADRPSGSGGTADPAAAAAAWQQDVVLQGAASLTLLLPRDARGELGSDTRCFAVPAGGQAGRELTAAQLLAFVHGYYAEELAPAEQLSLLQAYPAAEGAAAVLRPAFLELAALSRGALLGARSAFEGLRKATRDPAGAVYEVLLGS